LDTELNLILLDLILINLIEVFLKKHYARSIKQENFMLIVLYGFQSILPVLNQRAQHDEQTRLQSTNHHIQRVPFKTHLLTRLTYIQVELPFVKYTKG